MNSLQNLWAPSINPNSSNTGLNRKFYRLYIKHMRALKFLVRLVWLRIFGSIEVPKDIVGRAQVR